MKRAPFDAEIRGRIDSVVAELAHLVRLATLKALVDALADATGETRAAAPARRPKRGTKARVAVANRRSIPTAVQAIETAKVPSLEDYERAAIQRALIEADGNMIRAGRLLGLTKSATYRHASALGLNTQGGLVRPTLGSNLPLDLDAYERAAIDGALVACGRGKAATAKLLRMGRSTLFKRMRALGMQA